ncbi:helix-turn-helix domain-containing protein [Numidum massiliense]|uniref:helix-turn-helix domain-containing protein n=1 Tax=Numidum massiliense TaxID=1522315 RepID=UPI0006D57B6D|nr:RodZ domain-containing protein [Numidum massiliense]
MSGVGQMLKEAREAKGLSLHDVQEATKIQMRYLKAIEEDKLESLPGNFYTRAFIRTYAEFVDVDVQSILEQLKDAQEDGLEQIPELQKQFSEQKQRDREPSFSLAKWFSRGVLILFLILVGVVLYTALKGSALGDRDIADSDQSKTVQDKPQQEQVKKEGKEKTAEQDKKEAKKPAKPAVKVKKVNEQGSLITYAVSGAKKVELELKANERVWYEVKDGGDNGNVLASKEVQKGAKQKYTSNKGLWIRVGNTSGVTLKVNGKEISTKYDQPRDFLMKVKD